MEKLLVIKKRKMKKETEILFKIFALLEQIRDLFRLTAPDHRMGKGELGRFDGYLEEISREVKRLKEFRNEFAK